MKVGVYSQSHCPGIPRMLLDEGVEVSCWWKLWEPKKWTGVDMNGLQGLFPQTYSAEPDRPLAEWCADQDLIFIDYNDIDANCLEIIEKSGVPRIGPSTYADRLELDRAFGKSVIRQLDILPVPPSGAHFHSREELLTHLNRARKNVVLKGKEDTVVPHDLAEARTIADRDPFGFFKRGKSVYVEEKIYGKEIAFGRYLQADGRWVDGWVLTQEYKGAQNGNRGSILTAETGTVVGFVGDPGIPTAIQLLFDHLGPILKTSGYVGFLDVNCIHDGKSFQFLEFTCRPGYPTELEVGHAIHHAGLSYADFLMQLATGEGEMSLLQLPPFGVALAVFAQGLGNAIKWPGVKSRVSHGVVGHNISIQPFDCSFTENGEIWSNGVDRAVYITSYGTSVDKCIDDLYAFMPGVHCYGHTWRDDIGSQWYDELSYPKSLPHAHHPRRRRFQYATLENAEALPIAERRLLAAQLTHVELSANWRDPSMAWHYDGMLAMISKPGFHHVTLESVESDPVIIGFLNTQVRKRGIPLFYNLAIDRIHQGAVDKSIEMYRIAAEYLDGLGYTQACARCHDKLIPYHQRVGFDLVKAETNNNLMVIPLDRLLT